MNESNSSKGSDSPLTKQIVRPQDGNCDCCGKKNCSVQNKLMVENMDAFYVRTDGKGDPEDRLYISICKECFVIPDEGFEWDEDGEYPNLNQRNTIWNMGDWEAKSP